MWSSAKSIAPVAVTVFLTSAYADVIKYPDYQIPFEKYTESSNLNGLEWSSTNTFKLKKQETYKSEVNEASVSDVVNQVKITLGLPNKDIAEVFQVTRQTLHSYKNGDNTHNLHEQNFTRVKELKNIFEEIKEILPNSPGALVKTYLIENQTLFDLLKASVLEKGKILSFAEKLQRKIDQKSGINRVDQSDIIVFELTKHA
ncbi:hypothetical protein OHW66_03235 [Acinetobacter baumannii]|nr:hypothetical protein [Acinetobacter baumannii]